MTLTHTMTLTDDQAELLAAWSKAELEKHGGHAPVAAYVLNSLIQSHLVEWVQNKWHHDREGQMDEVVATAPTVEEENEKREAARKEAQRREEARVWQLEQDQKKMEERKIREVCESLGNKSMQVYKGGPSVIMVDFALAWFYADSPINVWRTLRTPHQYYLEMPKEYDHEDKPYRWQSRVGDKGVAIRMSVMAGKLRKAGVPMKQMKRGKKVGRR